MAAIRHDWYQTDQKLVVTILLKNANEKNCKVTIETDRLLITADDYTLDLQLLHPINVDQSTYRIVPVKIEVTLAKLVGERWEQLERKPNVVQPEPSGVRINKWDQVAKEADEINDADPLQDMFQKIYQTSDPNIKRAMDKSFSESGGTVLSTNWEDVGAKKVDVKPPDGVEFKRWQ